MTARTGALGGVDVALRSLDRAVKLLLADGRADNCQEAIGLMLFQVATYEEKDCLDDAVRVFESLADAIALLEEDSIDIGGALDILVPLIKEHIFQLPQGVSGRRAADCFGEALCRLAKSPAVFEAEEFLGTAHDVFARAGLTEKAAAIGEV